MKIAVDTLFADDLGADALKSWDHTTDWISDCSLIKHNLDGEAGKSNLSSQIDDLFTNGTTTWTFRMSSVFEPTTSNKFCYWLMASKSNLSDNKTSGYAVGVCITGSAKNLVMCRVDANGTKTVLYQTRYLWNDQSDVKIIVTRTAKGS